MQPTNPESAGSDGLVDLDDLLIAPEVMAMLSVARATVDRWAIEGRLPVAKQLPGSKGARLFRRADVLKLARELLGEAEARAAELRQAVAL